MATAGWWLEASEAGLIQKPTAVCNLSWLTGCETQCWKAHYYGWLWPSWPLLYLLND